MDSTSINWVHQLTDIAGPHESSPASSSVDAEAFAQQLSKIGSSGGPVLVQAPTHELGASLWGTEPMARTHEYTPSAPLDGGGGAMLCFPALQHSQETGVFPGHSARPAYSEDAPLILGLKKALAKGGAKPPTVGATVRRIFSLDRWLVQNNKPGIAARLYDKSLDDDVETFLQKAGSAHTRSALTHLRDSQLTGGAASIAGRTVFKPYPDDATLIRGFVASSGKRTFRSPLRGFGDYLRSHNKQAIAARLHDKSLDEDAELYETSGGSLYTREALSHLRGTPVKFERWGSRIASPDDAALIAAAATWGYAPATSTTERKAVSRWASALRAFSQWLEQNGRKPIIGRLNDPDALKKDLADFNRATNETQIGKGLELLRNYRQAVAADDPVGLQPLEQGAERAFAQQSAPQRVVGSPVVLPAEGYDQDLLWGMVDEAVHSPALQQPEFGAAVRQLNWRAPDELIGALDRSDLLPTEPGQLTSFLINGAMSPEFGEPLDVSFAVPEDFVHRTQPVPDRMLSRLRHFGLLPDAAQPVMSYDIRGERYTAALGPGGPNDVQLIHHLRASSGAVPARMASAPSDIYGGLETLVGLNPTTPFDLSDDAHSVPAPALPPFADPSTAHQHAPQLFDIGEFVDNDWRHGPQQASSFQIDVLRDLALLPSHDVPMTFFLINGEPYTAENLAGGRVLLFHRPQGG